MDIINYLLSKSHLLMAFMYGGLLAIVTIEMNFDILSNIIYLGVLMSAFYYF